MLGAFLLGRLMPRANGRDAVVAFLATLAVMTYVVRSYPIAFTWYVPLGVIVTVLVGGLMSLTHPAPAPALRRGAG